MNKRQKQLINTYLRKRDIAYEQHKRKQYNPYDYLTHEISYKIKNNINTQNITRKQIFDTLLIDNSIIDYVSNDFFNGLDGTQISTLISFYYPELINRFNEKNLNKLDTINVSQILHMQPHLVDKLPLQNLTDEYIIGILAQHPQLFDKLPVEIIRDVIKNVEQDEYNTYYRNNALKKLEKLFNIHPQLRKKFKERDVI